MQTVLHALISVLVGVFASAICTASWWYLLSFYGDSYSGFPSPVTAGRGSGLALVAGMIIGAVLGGITAIITIIVKPTLIGGFAIGATIGVLTLIIFVLLPSGGMPNTIAIALISLVFIQALIGFLASLSFNWLNNSISLK